MSIKKYTKVENIFNRIKEFYKLPTDAALAEFIGVEYSKMMQWKRRNSIPRYDLFIFKCPGIRIEFLETGTGEMFTSPLVAEASPAYGVTQTIQGLTLEETELIRIARECPEAAAVVRMMGAVDSDTQANIYHDAEKEKRMYDLIKELQDKKAG